MVAIIDICNQALSEIGTQSQISSFDDGSVEGQQCALWYDSLRKRMLRTAQWGFARRQVTLTQLGDLIPDQTSPYPYLYKYAYPADALKIRYILAPPITINNSIAPSVGVPVGPPQWLSPSRANRFIIAGDVDDLGNQIKVILSNVCNAIGVYTADITDPNIFDDLFSGALASALAYKLCIPLSGNVGMRDEFAKAAEFAILQARVADGNEAIPSSDIRVDWIETRGVGSARGAGLFNAAGANGWGSCFGSNENMAWGS